MAKKVLVLVSCFRKKRQCRPVVRRGLCQSAEKTQAGFRGFPEYRDDSHEKGVIYGTGAWKIGDIQEIPALTNAFNAGKNI